MQGTRDVALARHSLIVAYLLVSAALYLLPLGLKPTVLLIISRTKSLRYSSAAGTETMALVESPGQAQHGLEPVFRRVVPATTASPVDNDGLAERSDGRVNQHISIQTQQSVNGLTERLADGHEEPVKQKSRLIVAVDFGTTYSGVSYAKIDPGVDPRTLATSDIRCINNYEFAKGSYDARENARLDNVPTKLLYVGPGAPVSEQSDTDPDSDDDYLSDLDVQPISAPDSSDRRRRKRGRKSCAPSPRQKQKTIWSRPAGVRVRWGFRVQREQEDPRRLLRYPQKEAVELIKLTLGEDSYGDEDLRRKREELTQQIDELRSRSIIQGRDHLLRDYLARLLQHAKVVLEGGGLLDSTQLEYVLCVPVFWSEEACRTMHDAMVKAIQTCKLGDLAQDLIPDLFIVSEAEAAAQYVIASLGTEERLRQGEVFIILDAGGGTVDITTYKVTSNEMGPLRLQAEVIAPDGALCGSSLIKERYLRKLRAKLEVIDKEGDPKFLDGVAIAFANEWDMHDKPRIDVTNKKTMSSKFGGRKYHKDQIIKWTENEIRDVFEDSLKGTTDLLEKQIQRAKEKHLIVNKLIVVGGFGESPSLNARISQVLFNCCNSSGEEIEVIWPIDFPSSAVARGAVLRALDKRNGPSRISRSSFGVLRHERYGAFEEHSEENVVPERDDVDHDNFVRDTIYWLIQEVSTIHSWPCHCGDPRLTKRAPGRKTAIAVSDRANPILSHVRAC
jgi:hypothetical protein